MQICAFELLFVEWDTALLEGREMSRVHLLPAILAHSKVCASCKKLWEETQGKPLDPEREAQMILWEPDNVVSWAALLRTVVPFLPQHSA